MQSIKIFFPLVLCFFFGCGDRADISKSLSNKTEPIVVQIPDFQIVKEQVVLNPNEGKWYFENQPFFGYAIAHHKNGSISEKIGFYDGKKEGAAEYYYDDGTLRKHTYFIANKLDGVAKVWSPSPDRVLISESNYELGVRHGVQKQWYPSGSLFKQVNLSYGKEEGRQQAWRENGKLYVNYEAKNGRIFGLKRSSLCYELENEIVQR